MYDCQITAAMESRDFLQFLTMAQALCGRAADGLPQDLTDKVTGAFVSLHAHGLLRGCIGTTGPTTASMAWEIMQNAVSAAKAAEVRHVEIATLLISARMTAWRKSAPWPDGCPTSTRETVDTLNTNIGRSKRKSFTPVANSARRGHSRRLSPPLAPFSPMSFVNAAPSSSRVTRFQRVFQYSA